MRTVIKHNIVFIFLLFLGLPRPLGAYPSHVGVRAVSLGEAYRAVASGNDIIFYNPAGLIKNRHVGADVDYVLATVSRLNALSVSLVDSRTTAWGLGLAYNAGITAKSDTPTTHLAYMALAMPLGTDQVSLGVGFSYLNDRALHNAPYKHFFNLDVGLLADLGAGLKFAVVADHLLDGKGIEKPFGLSLGSAFALGDLLEAVPLTVSFDWTMKDIKSDGDLGHEMGFGFQYLALTMVPLRFGYKSEILPQNQLMSLGTGIMVQGFSFDALYQQHLTVGKIRQFGFAVRIEI